MRSPFSGLNCQENALRPDLEVREVQVSFGSRTRWKGEGEGP